MGLYTFSLLDRSSVAPIGNVSFKSSLIGSCARFESSASSVVVKTFVIASAGLPLVRGVFDRLSMPMLSVAVDEIRSKS